MINLKAVKETNNAISAINILYNDYIIKNSNQEKCFLILKIFYSFRISNIDGQRKIFIKNIDSFFLDEIDLKKEHQQDSRNWSSEFNANSKRLQISDSFKKNHKLNVKNISYKNTIDMLNSVINRNKLKVKK